MPRVILSGLSAIAAAVLATTAAGCAAWAARAGHAGAPASTASSRVPHTPAHRAHLPGVYLGAMAGPWRGPSVRPRSLLLGADWSISNIRWTGWSQRSATGQGSYLACQGADGPCDRFHAVILVNDVQERHGARYFSVLKVTRSHGQVTAGGHRQAIWLVMNTQLGWWQRQARPR